MLAKVSEPGTRGADRPVRWRLARGLVLCYGPLVDQVYGTVEIVLQLGKLRRQGYNLDMMNGTSSAL